MFFSINPSKGFMSIEWVCSLLEEKQLSGPWKNFDGL